MTKEEYVAKRKTLLDEAESFVNAAKFEDLEAKKNEISELDNVYEKQIQAQADMEAMKDHIAPAVEMADVVSGEIIADVDEKKMYEDAFSKFFLGHKLTIEESNAIETHKFQNDTIDSGSNALVIPESLKDAIWKAATEAHPVLNAVAPTFIQGDVVLIVDENEDADGVWVDEDTAASGDDVPIIEIPLKGNELVKCVTVSWKLKKMSISAFIPYLGQKIGEKVGNALAKSYFTGLGQPGTEDDFKGQATGVVTKLEAEDETPQIVNYTGTPTYTELIQFRALVKSGYADAMYAKSDFIWNKLANVLDGNDRPYFIPDPTSGGVGRMFGIPVFEEDGAPNDGLILGSFAKAYGANINEAISLYMEDRVKDRQTDYMAYMIADGSPMTTKAFAYLKKSA